MIGEADVKLLLLTLLLLPKPNPNPLHLDAQGRATIYLEPGKQYRLELQASDCNGVPEWSADGVSEPNDATKKAVPDWQKMAFSIKGGRPAAGYWICSYESGTRTPLATYAEPFPSQRHRARGARIWVFGK